MPVALTIAGSDPSGGAGIQADLKTFHRFGVYGEAVITLVTAQNTRKLTRMQVLSGELVREQIRAAIEDIPPAAAKTGALGSREVVEAVAEEAASFPFPLVVDPVIHGTRGGTYMGDDAFRAFLDKLTPRAFLVTPNLMEACAILGYPADSRDDIVKAARKLISLGAKNALIKGGHRAGDAIDLLLTGDGQVHEFAAPRIDTSHTHGSGCTLSAAITAELAKGTPLVEAVGIAKRFVTEAIRTNPGLGSGNGPLNHWA